jgi:hypothetical protein
MKRSDLIENYEKLKKLHLRIGIIGISLIMSAVLYFTLIIIIEPRSESEIEIHITIFLRSLFVGVLMFSTFIPIWIVESKQEKLLKQINALSKDIRQDITNQIETLKNNIKEVWN